MDGRRASTCRSTKDRLDGLAVGESIGPAGEVDHLPGGVEAESPEERGGEVGGGDGVGVGVGAQLVAGAEGDSATDAAAGQDHAVAVGPVVAPGAGVDLGRSAELAHGDDQGFVEQPAIGEIVDQGGKRPVGWWDQVVLEPAEDVWCASQLASWPLYWPS